jgi:flagellar hook-length control protein FliK
VNASGLTAPAATGVISPKNTQTINTLVGRFTPVDKFSGSTEAPELKAGEIAPKYMTTIIAGKDGASISDKIRGSSDASAVNVDDISKPNAGLITLQAVSATTINVPASIINKDSAATADMPKGNSESPEPNLGMITHKSMPSISSSKDAAIPSNKLRGSAVASELIADKATQNTVPSITANIATATAPTKIGANVVTFAKELELRDKLDATLAVPSTQATTPQANLVQSMANTPTFGAQAVQLVIDTPITQKQWGNDFSQKITWMATQQDQHAELHLNPAQLGPVDVVIKVSGDQATAQFTSAHAAVREVIEQSIPKLREMLADNGIMLGNATVSDQAPREQRGEFGNQRQTAPSGRLLESAPSNMSDTRVVTPLSRHNGMVDTFA